MIGIGSDHRGYNLKNEIKKVELSQRLSDFKPSFEGCIRIRVG